MGTTQKRLWFCSAFLVLAGGGLWWHWAAAARNAPRREKSKTFIASTDALGGTDRYLTYVSTDKPMYRPGERLYVRAVVLHHATHRPLPINSSTTPWVEIKGPKGDVVASGYAQCQDSVAALAWDIPPGQAGGRYAVRVSHPWQGYAPARRTFDIRAFRAPRLKSQIKFVRDGYGPGDEVAATLHVERAEGGVPAGAKVTAIARVDGQEAYRGPATVDAAGNCAVRFQLPLDIRRGEGTLAMIIEDGGVVETASKTIPILLQTVDLTMYPEGGQLVAGLPSRVYFEAFTPAGKPADLAGVVIDDEGNEVARFRSEHEGRGRFELTPRWGTRYTLKITEPSGIKTGYPLPPVKSRGVVLRVERDLFRPGEPISLLVGSVPPGPLRVTIAKRETILAEASADSVAAGPSPLGRVTFRLPPAADGVLTATVWDQSGRPRAERLIYRQPAKSIHVSITADAPRYTPGGKVKLTIQTLDEAGRPVRAVVGVTVTDDSVLEMIERREQAPRLPVMVLLESDVRDLADAHVYLDPKNEKAPVALDLLLGTQGWRRFALIHPAKFIELYGDAARRVLALRMATRREIRAAARGAFGGRMLVERAAAEAAPLVEDARHNARPGEKKPASGPVEDEDERLRADRRAGGPDAARHPAAARLANQLAREADQKASRLASALRRAESRERAKRLIAADAPAEPPFGARNDWVAVRVYAHQVRPNRRLGQRLDFTETLCWHAGLKTDRHGRATVEFALNDAVTSFRVVADAFCQTGALGTATAEVQSAEPFYVEPKVPLEVTAGDRIRLPVAVVNATGAPLDRARLSAAAPGPLKVGSLPKAFPLPADARVRRVITIAVGQHNGPAELTLHATAGPYADRVTRKLTIKPPGFPIQYGRGGLLSPGDTVAHRITIPENLVPKSLDGRVVVYPTPLANMTEALEGLIREPYGCFEQASSTIYPLVMAQQYFMSHQGVDPALIERSGRILSTGYERLLGFECKRGGYEWFGSDPGHDALTAYGVLEFTDMAQVRRVDAAMLQRTQSWLLAQRDGQGGFTRKTHTLHTWLADPEVANAYNTWALLQAGVDADLSREVGGVRRAAGTTHNTYVTALAANVLALAGDGPGRDQLLDQLSAQQTADGWLAGATTSVVGSGGEALKIETTALAVLAWLKNPRYARNVEKAIRYLAQSCKAGRFGSTQSTVLALRAIVAYDQSRAKPKAPGSLRLLVDGRQIGEPVKFDQRTQGAIKLPALTEPLSAGKHRIELAMTGGSQMPYSVAVEYHSVKPASAPECKVQLQVRLRDRQLDEGVATEAEVVLVNRTGQEIPMPVAVIGIPGGLEVRHDQLKELVKAGRIAAYEVIGREVVLYWRVLRAEERVELPLSLIAAVPGRYTGPASRAYLYYTDEHKHWVGGLTVTITPKTPH